MTMRGVRALTRGALSILLCACNGGEGGNDGGARVDATAEADAGSAFGDVAYFVFSRVRSPDSRTMYASILPSLEHGRLDLGGALELSGLSRARVFEESLYAFDGETGTVTRYAIGTNGALTPDTLADGETPAELSFAGLGVTRFSSLIVFVDAERAFYVDMIFEDVVVEWNPTEMTITRSFEAGLTRPGYDASSGRISRIDDYLVVPVSWTNQLNADYVPRVAVGILDLNDPTALTVIEDDRCVVTSDTFVYDGAVYAVGDGLYGLADLFANGEEVPPPCLVRWRPGAETFDPDFYVDLRELTGEPHVAGAVSRGDGTFVTQVYTSDTDPSTLGPSELLDDPSWQRAVVDLRATDVEVVEALEPAGISAPGWVVDDHYLLPRHDARRNRSSLYRLEGTDAPELLTVEGELFVVERVR